jgi:hypothetical protein
MVTSAAASMGEIVSMIVKQWVPGCMAWHGMTPFPAQLGPPQGYFPVGGGLLMCVMGTLRSGWRRWMPPSNAATRPAWVGYCWTSGGRDVVGCSPNIGPGVTL